MKTHRPITFGQGRYVVEKELGRGGMGIVYQTIDIKRDMRVALKTLRWMDPKSLFTLKREFRSLHDFAHPNVCSLMELVQDENTWFFTMELINGVDFLSYVYKSETSSVEGCNQEGDRAETAGPGKNASPLVDEERLRNSLAGLCNGLNALHAAGKVHRDIKPSNVMVTHDGRVVLMDFGLISERRVDHPKEKPALIGTAAYMAPEQADSTILGPEADWYAVGVILFEALTGKLPFEGSPMKMVLEKQVFDPKPPSDIISGLPKDLDQLCFGLLSRDPKLRPNPAEFLNLLDSYSSSSSSPIVTNVTDSSQNEVFIGRKDELELLETLFKKSAKGSFESVVIEGVSGVGKSALVESFLAKSPFIDDSTVVLRGQCYEHESAPFKAFDGIIECIIRHLANISNDEATLLKPRHPDLLLRLFPTLRAVKMFADIPLEAMKIEDPLELQRRSFSAFGEVLSTLGKQRKLVLIIDDMQWSDTDSFTLLKHLVIEDSSLPMLLIILSRYIQESGESAWDWSDIVKPPPTRMHLGPLSVNESKELTLIFINREKNPINVDPELIASEAAGHPMYIGELVQYLTAYRGSDWKKLRLDDAIWQRVNALPETSKTILEFICVAGAPMTRSHLQKLTDVPSEIFYKNLSLLRSTKFIKGRNTSTGHLVESYHDRVRESVLKKLNERGVTENLHLKIGRFLLDTYSDENIERNVFEVLKHFQEARRLVFDKTETNLVAKLYLKAGMRARYSSAYAASLRYLEDGISILPNDMWENSYQLALALHEEAAESSRLAMSRKKLLKYTDIVFQNATSILDKVNVLGSKAGHLYAEGNYIESLQSGIEILKQLGLKIPYSPGKGPLIIALLRAKGSLYRKTDEEILKLPSMTNKKILAAMRILSTLSLAAYNTNKNLYAFFIFTQIRLISHFGHSEYSAMTYCSWGVILCGKLGDREGGYRYGRLALKLRHIYPNTASSCRIQTLLNGFIFPWKDSLLHTATHLRKAHAIGIDTGDYQYSAVAISLHLNRMLLGGYMELGQLVAQMRYHIRTVKKLNQTCWSHFIASNLYFSLNLLYATSNPLLLDGEEGSEEEILERSEQDNDELIVWTIHGLKTILSVYWGRFEEGLPSARQARSLREYHLSSGTPSSAYAQLFEGIVYLRGADEKHMRLVDKIENNLAKYAKRAPVNYRSMLTLLRAEKYRNLSKYNLAAQTYKLAIEHAIQGKQVSLEALGNELAADFHYSKGELIVARNYAAEAQSAYDRWGAQAKVKHVEEKMRSLL